MQQNAMFKSPLFNLTKKASRLCYCCPGVTQATKMVRKGCLHEMYTIKRKRKIVFQQIITLLSCQVQSKGVYAEFKSRDDTESGHGLHR